MKRLAFAIGLLTLSVTAVTQAHADFAVVRFYRRLLPCLDPRISATSGLPVSGVSTWFA